MFPEWNCTMLNKYQWWCKYKFEMSTKMVHFDNAAYILYMYMQYVNIVTHYTNKGSLRTAQVGNIVQWSPVLDICDIIFPINRFTFSLFPSRVVSVYCVTLYCQKYQ